MTRKTLTKTVISGFYSKIKFLLKKINGNEWLSFSFYRNVIYILYIINQKITLFKMKKLFSISLVIFTAISLMTSCGEKGTGNATADATPEATVVVKDTTAVK
jgi:predicted small lipoprotein YifL